MDKREAEWLVLLLSAVLCGCGLSRHSIEPPPTPLTGRVGTENTDAVWPASSKRIRPQQSDRTNAQPLRQPDQAAARLLPPPERAEPNESQAPAQATANTKPTQPAPFDSDQGPALPPMPQPMATSRPSSPPAAVLEPVAPLRAADDTSVLVELLRAHAQGQSEELTRLLARYDPTERELLRAVLPVMVKLNARGKADPHDLEACAQKMQSLLLKQTNAALSVQNVHLCRRVRRFADFVPLPADYRLRPGELIELYFEVRNFTTTCPGVGQPCTVRLAYTLEVVQINGQSCWTGPLEPINDTSMTPRQDFYQSIIFKVPDLPVGEYRLIVHVTDCQSGQRAQQSVNLPVQATGRNGVVPGGVVSRVAGS